MSGSADTAREHDGPGAGAALVLGASRGLGLLVAQELLRRGFVVHGGARDADELRGAERILRAAVPGGRFVAHVCDVREQDAVSRVVDVVLDTEGRLDAAFHVAGVIQVGHIDTVTLGHFHDAVDTMLWGPVHLALAAIPSMRDAGHGRLGIVSSVGGLVAVPRLVPYSVAKFGAVGLAEGLYAELAGTGVTVTAVTPGLMRTGGHTHARFVDDSTDYAWFTPPGLAARRQHLGGAGRAPHRLRGARRPADRGADPAHHRGPAGARAGPGDHGADDGPGEQGSAGSAAPGARAHGARRAGRGRRRGTGRTLLARRRRPQRAR